MRSMVFELALESGHKNSVRAIAPRAQKAVNEEYLVKSHQKWILKFLIVNQQ
jgi:hypothetical protein